MIVPIVVFKSAGLMPRIQPSQPVQENTMTRTILCRRRCRYHRHPAGTRTEGRQRPVRGDDRAMCHIDGVPARRASGDNVAFVSRVLSWRHSVPPLLPLLVPHKLQLRPQRGLRPRGRWRACGHRAFLRGAGALMPRASLPPVGQIDGYPGRSLALPLMFLRPAGFMRDHNVSYAGMVDDPDAWRHRRCAPEPGRCPYIAAVAALRCCWT